MKNRFTVMLCVAFLMALPAFAQQHGEAEHGQPPAKPSSPATPRANQGHPPPAPSARTNPRTKQEAEHYDAKHTNNTPHVNNDHWYGHDQPNDARYRIAKPFEHGHFDHVGASYRYNVVKIDRDHHRFWFPGGFYFEVASWEWAVCADWCWDCADDFTIYEDPDHPGWYLLYNLQTGAYVHVQYMGT